MLILVIKGVIFNKKGEMKIKKKLALLTLGFVTMSSLTAFAQSGKSRAWRTTLPNHCANEYFPCREKFHDTDLWIFTVNGMKKTKQVNGWVAEPNKGRISDVIKFTNRQVESSKIGTITDRRYIKQGKSVRLAVENGEETDIRDAFSWGYVNYN